MGSHGRYTHELVVVARGVVRACFRGAHHHPNGSNDHLKKDQSHTNKELRFGADELGPLHRALACAEDPGDAIGFRQQRRVTHREAETNAELLRPTDDVVGFEDDDEGHAVTEQYAGKQHEAELPTGSLHHRRLAELDEDVDDVGGDDEAEPSDCHGSNSDVGVEAEVLLGDGNAGFEVTAGHGAHGASLAGVGIGQVLELGARDARPAAMSVIDEVLGLVEEASSSAH